MRTLKQQLQDIILQCYAQVKTIGETTEVINNLYKEWLTRNRDFCNTHNANELLDKLLKEFDR